MERNGWHWNRLHALGLLGKRNFSRSCFNVCCFYAFFFYLLDGYNYSRKWCRLHRNIEALLRIKGLECGDGVFHSQPVCSNIDFLPAYGSKLVPCPTFYNWNFHRLGQTYNDSAWLALIFLYLDLCDHIHSGVGNDCSQRFTNFREN